MMLDRGRTDIGLQPQRTVLSWFRTSAVVFLNSLLLIKIGIRSESNLLLFSGGATLLLAILMYAYSIQRNQVIDYDIDLVCQKTIIVHRVISIVLAIIALLLFLNFLRL